MDLSKVLVTGADGMVGSYINFGIKTNRRSFDITDFRGTLAGVEKYRPSAILHLAAETDVDRCERDPLRAYLVNSIGTWNVAFAAKQVGAKVIYISTSYVFSGEAKEPFKESDIPSPPTYYGKSKWLGEIAIRNILDDYLILRAGWMFGGGPKLDQKFIAKIVKQLGNPEIKAVDDVTGSMTFAKDLVEKIKGYLLAVPPGGSLGGKIIHVFNGDSCSRYDVAAEIAKIGKSAAKVEPVPSTYFKLDAARGHSDRMESAEGGVMRSWKEALAEYLHEEWNLE